MNFIEIFNYVAKVARPAHVKVVAATSMEDSFGDLGLDSLDKIIMMMFITEIYGISEKDSKDWSPIFVKELHDLVMAIKTKEPASMEEVADVCK
jgi:acyl carrier protein